MPSKWVFIAIGLVGFFLLYQIDQARRKGLPSSTGDSGGGDYTDGLGVPNVFT